MLMSDNLLCYLIIWKINMIAYLIMYSLGSGMNKICLNLINLYAALICTIIVSRHLYSRLLLQSASFVQLSSYIMGVQRRPSKQ
jgi:hypothetical protein